MTNPNPYGFCPICSGPGVQRQRRLNGDDMCTEGHRYKSSESMATTRTEQSLARIDELQKEIDELRIKMEEQK